jgi:hypothetical protein
MNKELTRTHFVAGDLISENAVRGIFCPAAHAADDPDQAGDHVAGKSPDCRRGYVSAGGQAKTAAPLVSRRADRPRRCHTPADDMSHGQPALLPTS